MGLILLVLVILLLADAMPRWAYSRNGGYSSSGGLRLALVSLPVLPLVGRLPHGF